MKLRSYANIADVPVFDCDDGERLSNRPGDLTDEFSMAHAVLRRWLDVARFNIGSTAVLELLVAAENTVVEEGGWK